MELTGFNSRLGIGQARAIVAGEYVFSLGDLEAGYEYYLAPGDYAEVVQETNLSHVDVISADLIINTPKDVPVELAWEVSIVVSGMKYSRVIGRVGASRRVTDLTANVSKRTGRHVVGVRLELVEV